MLVAIERGEVSDSAACVGDGVVGVHEGSVSECEESYFGWIGWVEQVRCCRGPGPGRELLLPCR